MSEPLRLAYLTSAFARPSDTFVRSEVDRLRERGIEIKTYSIRRPTVDADADVNVREHQANTEYLLEAGPFRLLIAATLCAIQQPKQFFNATRLAWQTCAPGIRCIILQAIYLIEAVYLAKCIQQSEIKHLHNHIGENSATVAMLAACLADIPYSLTIHGPAIFLAPERWALGAKLDRAAFTACISSFCRSQCMMFAKPSNWHRLHVVRCAVGESFLDVPQRAAEETTTPLIVCVGRLCTEKGQSLLVNAVGRLAAEGQSMRLLLVGDGPLRETIESRIKELKLAEQVEITGWQSSERIRELLLQATAMVLPSFAEGLPIVLMEALALECPVITTNVAAIGELVTQGQNGWLLPPGEVESLTSALRELLAMCPEQLAELGCRGRQKVLELHHPNDQATKLLKLIRASSENDFDQIEK